MPPYTGDDLGDDLTGDEENIVGAVAAQLRRSMPANQANRMAAGVARAATTAIVRTGVNQPGGPRLPTTGLANIAPATIRAYCGLGTLQWAGTDEADKTLEVEPQQSFRGERLVITARYSSGATARLVTINRALTVAGLPQTPAPEQEAPIEMFAAEVTYSGLDLQIATSGTKISIGFRIDDAPGSGETVTVSAGLYGEWIR